MKISKCCGSSFTRNDNEMFGGNYNICDKCGAFCDTIEQPMQNTRTPMQKDKQYSDLTQEEKDNLHSNCCEGTNEAQSEIIKAYERGFIESANLTGSQALEELKEQKQNILELIYKEISKTTKNGKDSRGCKCLENIYQKIIKLK